MWHHELRWMRHVVRAHDRELRLDRWLRRQFPSLPQSFLQTQLRKRKIRLQPATDASGTSVLQTARANSILQEGSIIVVDAHLFHSKLQPGGDHKQQEAMLSARLNTPEAKKRLQELLDRVVYRDDQYLVVDKPHGLACHEGSALTNSLARYLPAIAAELGQQQEPLKLVHRLDKETSGVLVLARSRLAAAKFSELLRRGDVQKTYEALVSLTAMRLLRFERHEITLPVEGKSACTIVERVLARHGSIEASGVWLQLKPRTGRKHQLRVHCAEGLGASIVGDVKYGGPRSDRLYLHSKRLQFPDPFNPGKVIDVACNWNEH